VASQLALLAQEEAEARKSLKPLPSNDPKVTLCGQSRDWGC
jgi:hypothetical protein